MATFAFKELKQSKQSRVFIEHFISKQLEQFLAKFTKKSYFF